jgi:non-canonical (house-cleaning) NTP pyrophosphatase
MKMLMILACLILCLACNRVNGEEKPLAQNPVLIGIEFGIEYSPTTTYKILEVNYILVDGKRCLTIIGNGAEVKK